MQKTAVVRSKVSLVKLKKLLLRLQLWRCTTTRCFHQDVYILTVGGIGMPIVGEKGVLTLIPADTGIPLELGVLYAKNGDLRFCPFHGCFGYSTSGVIAQAPAESVFIPSGTYLEITQRITRAGSAYDVKVKNW